MTGDLEAAAAIAENPFYVLALPVHATRAAIEREGQKLLDQLDIGVASSSVFATPFGARPRTPEKVRWAIAELRDPKKRILHEPWASLPVATEAAENEALAPAADAFEAAGF